MATLVIVPGSFMPASVYAGQVESLAQQGISAVVVDLPSVGPRPQGAATMTDDADAIVAVAQPLVEQGKEVVLLTHSYGGIPGTQSLQRLSKKARAAQGKQGGVGKIAYLTSVIVEVGKSNYDVFGETLDQFITVENGFMSLPTAMVAAGTFADLSSEEAETWAKYATTQSQPSFKEPLTFPGYNDVDVHYILCGKDLVISPELQSGMIDLIEKSSGRKVTVHKLDSDHAPIASKTGELTAIVGDILKA